MDKIKKELMGIGELLKLSCDIFTKNARYIIYILLLVFAPLVVLEIGVINYFEGDDSFSSLSNSIKIIGWLETTIAIVGYIFIAYVTKNYIEEKTAEFGSLIGKTLNKWPIVFIGTILVSIYTGLLILLFIIPGVYFGILWIFTLQILTLEGGRIRDAMRRSRAIIKDHWWEMFGYVMLMIVCFLLVSLSHLIYEENIYLEVGIDMIISVIDIFFAILFTLKFINVSSYYDARELGEVSTQDVVKEEEKVIEL